MTVKKALSFIDIAERDLGIARKLVGDFNDGAALHLQQAAEKLLKALLTAHGKVYPAASHQMDDLLRHLPSTDPFYEDFVDFTGLTSAATAYRYPTPAGDVPDPPDRETCEGYRKKLDRLLPEVREHVRELDKPTPRGRLRK